MDEQTPSRDRVLAINDAAWSWLGYHARQPGDWTRDYLTSRGLGGLAAGYAPPGSARCVSTLRRRGFTDDELVAAGIGTRTPTGRVVDVFRDRLVLAIRDTTDQIIGFTARRNPETESGPKYLNTTTTAAYDKSRVLYGLDSTARAQLAAGATPVLVEGALDVEAVRRAGGALVPIAPCGTAITPAHLEVLRDVDAGAPARLLVAFDPDEAGRAAAARVWEHLTDTEAGTARAAELPDGLDPARLLELDPSALHQCLTHTGPLTHLAIDVALAGFHLEHVEGRLTAVRHLARHLARLEPLALGAAAAHLVVRVGDGLDPTTVHGELLAAYVAR